MLKAMFIWRSGGGGGGGGWCRGAPEAAIHAGYRDVLDPAAFSDMGGHGLRGSWTAGGRSGKGRLRHI